MAHGVSWPRRIFSLIKLYMIVVLTIHAYHRQAATAQASQRIRTISLEHVLLAHTKYGCRWKLKRYLSHIVRLHTSALAFKLGFCAHVTSTKILCSGQYDNRKWCSHTRSMGLQKGPYQRIRSLYPLSSYAFMFKSDCAYDLTNSPTVASSSGHPSFTNSGFP